MTKAFVYDAPIIHMGKVPQQTVIVTTAAIVTIVMWISTVAIVIPQAAHAQQDNRNPSTLSSDVDDNCAYDQLPASINGKIQCLRQGECDSEQVKGKEVKHCNFMMSGSDE
ncbi:MAG TPA: hypothetical protein VFY68_06025 [Nitrososphaeraceae archaeon]|nr:hypothetical protein [Nitrososphaeraceae archaeon]